MDGRRDRPEYSVFCVTAKNLKGHPVYRVKIGLANKRQALQKEWWQGIVREKFNINTHWTQSSIIYYVELSRYSLISECDAVFNESNKFVVLNKAKILD